MAKMDTAGMASRFEFLKRLSHIKLATLSMSLLFVGIIFFGFMFPMILKFVLNMNLHVKPGGKNRAVFEALPFSLTMDIYLFNVTNAQEVMEGGKPELQQIGPYRFDEWKTRQNIIDNDEDDTADSDYINYYHFRPDKTDNDLTGEEIVMVPHPLILSMLLAVNYDKPELMGFITKALDEIFHNPEHIFYHGPAADLMFRGIPLDCSSDDFEPSAVCSELESDEYPLVRRLNDSFMQFSLIGNTNATATDRLTLKRGKKDIMDLAKVVASKGETEFDTWPEDDCNQFHGTDGNLYPPYLKKTDDYWMVSPILCRSLQFKYKERSKYKGIPLSMYSLDWGVQDTEKPQCYCRYDDDDDDDDDDDEEGESVPPVCPLNGTYDFQPCSGVPILITSPHFYGADPQILTKFKSGIEPNAEKHDTQLGFYQFAGLVATVDVRYQVNLEVVTIEDHPLLGKVQPMYLPFAWYSTSNMLNKKFTRMVKFQLVYAKKMRKVMLIVCILLGIMGLAISATIYYQKLSLDGEFAPTKKKPLENHQVPVPDAATLDIINTNEINQRKTTAKA